MYAVYAARRLDDNEFKLIVSPLCKPESVKLLRNIYEWFLVDPNDIDDEKYQVLKKFSEVALHDIPLILLY
jgi:exportin-5